MKLYILIFFAIVLFAGNISAQKNDALWLLGYNYGITKPAIDFNSGQADTFSFVRPMQFFESASVVCNDSGSLLYYTNGETIANRNHDTLMGSQHFNDGWENLSYVPLDRGLLGSQELLSIPFPGDSNKYILFHECGEEFFFNYPAFPQPVYSIQPFSLKYTVIDKALDGGLGGVAPGMKAIDAIQDTLFWGWMAATKHGNGRDWWVVAHRWYSDLFYKLLVTPLGVSIADTQHIGGLELPFLSIFDTDRFGQAVFSPDGNKFAMAGQSNIIRLFDFDRCTGILSNYRSTLIDTTTLVRGCSFSPNNRFLYVSDLFNLYQYDTWQSNLDSSGIVVAVWDSFYVPNFSIEAFFFYHSLAFDGKIYLHTFGGSKLFHVINKPDLLGTACKFKQHSFKLPNYNLNLCYSPNYRLGPLIGSGCDTILAVNEYIQKELLQLKVFPNPAGSGPVTIQYNLAQNQPGRLTVYNLTGQNVYEQTLPNWSITQTLDLPDLDAGLYLMELTSGGKRVVVKWAVVPDP